MGLTLLEFSEQNVLGLKSNFPLLNHRLVLKSLISSLFFNFIFYLSLLKISASPVEKTTVVQSLGFPGSLSCKWTGTVINRQVSAFSGVTNTNS